jgi:hypothetical protein
MSAQEFQWSVKNGDLDAVTAVCPSVRTQKKETEKKNENEHSLLSFFLSFLTVFRCTFLTFLSSQQTRERYVFVCLV